jgi:oxysterol-binding protein-related protein 9/10/11
MVDKRRLIATSEYWHYLDRPETFVRFVLPTQNIAHCLILRSIGKSDDEVGRMLEVLRFWFTKDLVRRATCVH